MNENKAAALRRAHWISTSQYDLLNESVPAFAPYEWVIARHELGLLCRTTHADRKPIFRPSPLTFGGLERVNEVHDRLAYTGKELMAAGFAATDPVIQRLGAAIESLDNLSLAYLTRQRQVREMGGVTVPLHIPAGLIPQANHYTRWADGDGAECLRSWSIAGPGPDLTPMPLKF